MKTLNRKALKRARLIRYVMFFLFIAGAVMKSYILIGAAVLGELVSMIYFKKYNHCPHCGAYLPNLSPFGKDAGICHKCNETMEFDS